MPDSKKKILIVEDNEDQRLMLQVALTNAGYEVVMALAGEQALAYVESTAVGKAPVDLILLDVMLVGGMDGLEVLWKFKANPDTSSIPVIIMSAHLDEQRIQELLTTGAELYLTKPYDIEALVKTMGHILAAQEARLVRATAGFRSM